MAVVGWFDALRWIAMMMRRFVVIALVMVGGCGRPNAANIALRKEKQTLEETFQTLQQQRQADQATIAAMQSGKPPMLHAEQLDQLFTASEIEIGKLSGVRPEGLKIYVTPKDTAGDVLKSAGIMAVDVFDLSRKDQPSLGHFDFSADEIRKQWYSSAFVTGYAAICPIQLPANIEITVRVAFTDTLTGRVLITQKVLKTPPAEPVK